MKKNNGISLVGYLKEIHGLAQVSKDFLAKISLTNFDFDVYDASKIVQEKNKEFDRITTNKSQFKKRLIFDTCEQKLSSKYYNIKTIFWEFESGMMEFRPKIFEGVDEVIAFTDFIYNYLLKIAPKNLKVTKMKYPFIKNWDIVADKLSVRNKYNINPEDFVCFFNFDYRSSYERKNPEAILKAFAESIGQNNNTKIIIKTSGFKNASYQVNKLNEFVNKLGITDKVIFINEYLPKNEVISVLNTCDCYISLHRGEGLGLGMLEAMSLGKPVIATNYSGNTEFMREDDSLLVDYKLTKANDTNPAYLWVKKWAEPNIETAKEYLEKLYSDREFGFDLGQKAQQFIEEYYNFEDFKKEISEKFEIKENETKARCLSQKRKKICLLSWGINGIKKIFNDIKSLLFKIKIIKISVIKFFYGYNFEKEYKKIPEKFNFPQNENPLVSIIITTYNQYKYTKSCLWSILKNTKNIPYEIIIGDNISEDETKDICKYIGGINFIRHEVNEGFLMNANKTVPHAKGKYIVLLSNDIVVRKNWLKYLLETIEQDKTIGYVGSKYLTSDGFILEAGSYIKENGISQFYYQDCVPFKKQANILKEVDYCSGCGIILRKEIWDKLGGFSKDYKDAYFEDSDLCFQIRYNLGLKIIYQPKSEMYHFCGTTYQNNAKYYKANKKKFLQKWGKVLKK